MFSLFFFYFLFFIRIIEYCYQHSGGFCVLLISPGHNILDISGSRETGRWCTNYQIIRQRYNERSKGHRFEVHGPVTELKCSFFLSPPHR